MVFDFKKPTVQMLGRWQPWQAGYTHDKEYTIIKVPNIIEIAYGRNVGYSFIEYDLGEEVHKISATKIRKEMREQGSIKYIDMKHEDWPEG